MRRPWERARRVRLLLTDVDGTLTDGRLFLLSQGEEVKGYDVKDGAGILLARRGGIEVGFVTGKSSPGVALRASHLGVEELHMGVKEKVSALEEIWARRGLTPEETLFLGDDIMDLKAMERSGLGVAVADAHPFLRRKADYVTQAKGGSGALREVIEMVLASRGGREELALFLSRFQR